MAILRESLEAKVSLFGDFSPEVAETYRLLGGADLEQGNHRVAHKALKKVRLHLTLMWGTPRPAPQAQPRTLHGDALCAWGR